ncbi:hypothetical protein [Brachybacterium sp. FME24]|uniref:hypothetical protein n=1 Tax=Brachybacterium sp. FME24 TaxID=2742605 RepID=UPI00186846E8|nr:hypothetical protein [Brachybacterium sp. FME24]
MTRSARPRGPLTSAANRARRRILLRMLTALLGATLALAGGIPAALADPTTDEESSPSVYSATGQDIEGGGSLAQAALVAPGIYRDTFERGGAQEYEPGTTKYYRITVEDGQRVHAAATIAAAPYPGGVPEDYSSLGIELSYLTAGGDACDDGGTTDIGEAITGDGPITTTAVSDVVGPDGCTGGELFLQVTRTGMRSSEDPLPVEIQVALQPPGIGGGSPSVEEEIEDSGASPVAPEDTAPITLGRSFAGATPLEPGSSVVELAPGETGLARIEVQEGQRLRWRTEVISQPEGDAGYVALRTFDAARAQVTVGGGSWPLSTADTVAGGGMVAPVDRGNRSSELDTVQSAWLPGTHTIQLQRPQRTVEADPAGDGPVTLILTLEVEGEVAKDAADGTVLELGETTSTAGAGGGLFGGQGGLGRVAMIAGAGLLTVMALVSGVAGALVLRLRRN